MNVNEAGASTGCLTPAMQYGTSFAGGRSLQRELLLPCPFFTSIVAEYEGDLTILSL